MNFNIYIEESLAGQVAKLAKSLDKSRNSIIREALQDWITRQTSSQWSEEVLNFSGIEDFPEFEAQRKEATTKEE